MKINKIIRKLKKIKKKYGNIETIEIYKTNDENFIEEIIDIKYSSKYKVVAIISGR